MTFWTPSSASFAGSAAEELGERQPRQAHPQRVLGVALDVQRCVLDAVPADGGGEVVLGRGELAPPELRHTEYVLALDERGSVDSFRRDQLPGHLLGPVGVEDDLADRSPR